MLKYSALQKKSQQGRKYAKTSDSPSTNTQTAKWIKSPKRFLGRIVLLGASEITANLYCDCE